MALTQGILNPVQLFLTIIVLATPVSERIEFSASTLELNKNTSQCRGSSIQLKSAQLSAKELQLDLGLIRYCQQTSDLKGRRLELRSPRLRLTAETAQSKWGKNGVESVRLGQGYATRCACRHPLWTIKFESAEWQANQDIRIDWPTLTVFDVPLLILPYWSLAASGRNQGFGLPRFGWSADRGLRFGLPITWAMRNGIDWTFEMGRDGVDQYATSRVDWTDQFNSEHALQLDLIGSDINATGLGMIPSKPVSLAIELDWFSSPQRRGFYQRNWREKIQQVWTSSATVSAELGPVFLGLNTGYGQSTIKQVNHRHTWFTQTLFTWPHRVGNIQHNLGLDMLHADTDLTQETLVHVSSDASINRQYDLLRLDARLRNTLALSDAFGNRNEVWYSSGHLVPGLALLGRFGRFQHTIVLGPDLWMNRSSARHQTQLSSIYLRQKSLHGLGLRVDQELLMPSGHASLSVRRDVVNNQDQIDQFQVRARLLMSNTVVGAEALGDHWLSADVHHRLSKNVTAGLRAVSSKTAESRPRYIQRATQPEFNVPIGFLESRGGGPSIELESDAVRLSLSGLWGGPQLDWQGYYGKGSWHHSCGCLSVELECNQGRFEDRPNLFVNVRLDSN
ncbi:MAG: hypothetical protein VYA30_05245 [Myxococcota bacterium]|nr:hypothetical protein [Myxococcota bacterium]